MFLVLALASAANASSCLPFPCGEKKDFPCTRVVNAPYVIEGDVVDVRSVNSVEPEWLGPPPQTRGIGRQGQLTLKVVAPVRQPSDEINVTEEVVFELPAGHLHHIIFKTPPLLEPGDRVILFAHSHPASAGRGARQVLGLRYYALVREDTPQDVRCETVARINGHETGCGPRRLVIGAMGLPDGVGPEEAPDLQPLSMTADSPKACDGLAWTDAIQWLRSH